MTFKNNHVTLYLQKRKMIKKGDDNMFNRRLLESQMVLKGMNVNKLSEALGINESTFYRKLKNDGDFNRSEINTIIKLLDIEDPEPIFFAEELA